MNENNKKSKAGLIVIIVAIALMIVEAVLQIMVFKNTGIVMLAMFVPYFMLLLCGAVLMFVKIKKIGWAIVAALSLGGVISNLIAKDYRSAVIGAVLAVACTLILIYENTKKNKQ